ncbi:hypothetical protein UMZ34_21935 [Halopseudomonas pachastrellae]|nr:hypothetical protein UMZ34_21935 [Halopseudomonas pachastrellae]
MAEPILQTEEELLLTSAYFVPREPGERLLLKLHERGVDISVLTNSLATTDVCSPCIAATRAHGCRCSKAE